MSSAEGYGTEAFEKPSPSSYCDTSGNKDKVPEFKTLEREPPFGSTNALLTQNSLERLQQPLTIDTSSNMSFDQLRMIPRGECEVSLVATFLTLCLSTDTGCGNVYVLIKHISFHRGQKAPQLTFLGPIITIFRLSNFLAQASTQILNVRKEFKI